MTKANISQFSALGNSPFWKGEKPMKEAYCVELGKVITVNEAWAMVFGDEKNRIKARSLTFKCPDPNCRANLVTSSFREFSSSSEMGFRTHLKAVHNPYCSVGGKSTLGIEVTSPEQARELLCTSLWSMCSYFLTRLEEIERKIKA